MPTMTNTCISIDCMGSDKGPAVIYDGVCRFARKFPQAQFVLHGDGDVLQRLVGDDLRDKCRIEHSDKQIHMDQPPAQALRTGRGSSMWNAIKTVKSGEAGAVVSGGNTGALMAMSKIILRTIEGLHRPALMSNWPSRQGMVSILDVGANVDADPLQLAQFAVLGDVFARTVHRKDNPKISILNIGSEDFKGFKSLQEAGRLIERSSLNYNGFIEANAIYDGTADVVVTNGFTGNVAIKCAEGTAEFISEKIQDALSTSLYIKLLAMAIKPIVKSLLDHSELNGAVFAGLRGISVKSHGNATASGFARALKIAHDMAGTGFDAGVSDRLRAMSAIRPEEI